MSAPRRCPQCHADLPADAPADLCPACLLQAAMLGGSNTTTGVGPAPVATADVPAALVARFPQFEILGLLGEGGMGIVYKARQKSLDRIVALKILEPEAGQAPAFTERFGREARALARLNHPGIVTVFDFGESDGLYYLVMEFVDGVNLRQLLAGGKMKPAEALRIVPQLCEALQYAHDEGVVHRDIKPENILLDKKGRVKIADFGLAKLLGKATPDVALTGTNQVMGTLRYMAPEQLEGSRDVDHRADIYSLGVTFYEMLTGELPIGRFAPPSKKVEIDVRLDEVVLRSLEREPELRYQHASEIKTEMETIERSSPTNTPPPPAQQSGARSFASYLLVVVFPMALLLLAEISGTLAEISGAVERRVTWGILIGVFLILNSVWLFRKRAVKKARYAAVDDRIGLPSGERAPAGYFRTVILPPIVLLLSCFLLLFAPVLIPPLRSLAVDENQFLFVTLGGGILIVLAFLILDGVWISRKLAERNARSSAVDDHTGQPRLPAARVGYLRGVLLPMVVLGVFWHTTYFVALEMRRAEQMNVLGIGAVLWLWLLCSSTTPGSGPGGSY